MPTATQDTLATAVDALRLTDDQIKQMAQVLYEQARVPTYTARYQRAAQTLRVVLPPDWQPAEAALGKMAEDALSSARGISATYHADLEARARLLQAAGKAQHKGVDDLLRDLADWARDRMGWKSAQIANWEASDAGNDGSFDFLGDLYGGAVTPGIDLESVEISCLPVDAKEARCQEYAGNTYSLDDYEAISDVLPMHGNCPHEFVITLR